MRMSGNKEEYEYTLEGVMAAAERAFLEEGIPPVVDALYAAAHEGRRLSLSPEERNGGLYLAMYVAGVMANDAVARELRDALEQTVAAFADYRKRSRQFHRFGQVVEAPNRKDPSLSLVPK